MRVNLVEQGLITCSPVVNGSLVVQFTPLPCSLKPVRIAIEADYKIKAVGLQSLISNCNNSFSSEITQE